MTDLPGYDQWKQHDPNDDRCEFCGALPHERLGGWQPTCCTGKCHISWRDPDFEYDQMRDEKDESR